MAIEYALYPNHLTDDPDDHRGLVQHQHSLSQQDIIDDMVSRGSTTTRADALATLEDYQAAIERGLTQGYRINTPLMNLSLSISGIFNSHEDYFDRNRHQLKINCNCGLRLKALPEKLSLKKKNPYLPHPVIMNFQDIHTETSNQQLTPGGVAIVRGNRLKIDLDDPRQGVFFRSNHGTDVRVDKLIRNMPKELIFAIPGNLNDELYTFEVRSIPKPVTKIRTGTLDAKLQPS